MIVFDGWGFFFTKTRNVFQTDALKRNQQTLAQLTGYIFCVISYGSGRN